MVTEIQNGAIERSKYAQAQSSELSLTHRAFDSKVIVLSSDQLKQLQEVARLAANFQSDAVKEAYIEIASADQATAVLEISKNAKPSEVGLRYSREIWITVDTISTKQSVRTVYSANAEMTKLRSIACENTPVPVQACEPLRINLKDGTVSVHVKPPSANTATAVTQKEVSAIPDIQPNVEVESSHMPTENTAAPAEQNSSRNFSATDAPPETTKYAPYSRSEVDRMFKQQTEAIATSLGVKISNQTKIFQESIDQQQKAFNKSIDKVVEQVDHFRMKLEANAANQKTMTKEQLDRFSSELTKELEQFKASLNKSILPNIKTIDEKLRAVDETLQGNSNQSHPQSTSGGNATVLTVLVGACLIASIISIVLQVVHH